MLGTITADEERTAAEEATFDRVRSERNRDLIARAQADEDAAMEALVIENAGLVRSLAQRFCGRGTEFEDLIQIGTIGMIKAVRSFSLERGTAFSTYVVPLIVGEIRRHLRDDGMIRVSRTSNSWAHSSCECEARSWPRNSVSRR